MSETEGTAQETVLVTRFCRRKEGGRLRSDFNLSFEWPRKGPVSCPDWDPTPRCGNGLHGWLWGKGATGAWSYHSDDVMLVVEVLVKDIVSIEGGSKVKFPKGVVVHCGTRKTVTKYMAERGHVGIVYGHMVVGDNETAEVGDHGTAKAGKGGTAIAGKFSKAIAGIGGTAIAGKFSTAIAGAEGTATAATDFSGGTAIVGPGGTASAAFIVFQRGKRGPVEFSGLRREYSYSLDKKGTLVVHGKPTDTKIQGAEHAE